MDSRKEEKLVDRSLNWQDVTIKQMAECSTALSFLDPDGYHYYLPAYIILSLEYEDDRKYNGYAFMDSPEYSLSPAEENLRDYVEVRHSRFDTNQVKAIIDYLEYRLTRNQYDSLVAASLLSVTPSPRGSKIKNQDRLRQQRSESTIILKAQSLL
jgi:hypothetical protein